MEANAIIKSPLTERRKAVGATKEISEKQRVWKPASKTRVNSV